MKSKIQNKNKTGLFIICLVLLVAVVLIINFTLSNKETKIEYKGQCDSELHGIQVEEDCYNCGVSDDVCPEDFGVDCKVIDPDCS
jgi:hypothetical protein